MSTEMTREQAAAMLADMVKSANSLLNEAKQIAQDYKLSFTVELGYESFTNYYGCWELPDWNSSSAYC